MLASAHARLSAALADLAIPDRLRLSERQRGLVASLLDSLVSDVEDDLRIALAHRFESADREALHAALSSAHVPIAGPILAQARRFPTPWLLAALLRRSEEHRIHRASAGNVGLLLDLAGDEEPEIAGEAMAILIAQSGRLDAFQEPLIARIELPAEIEHGLVWTVAAALQLYMVERHAVHGAEADEAITAAATALLSGYDEGSGLPARCLRLAGLLERAGRLDGQFIARTLGEAGLSLFLAALSARTGLSTDSLWDILSDPEGYGPALVLSAAGLDRSSAASILLLLLGEEEEALAETLERLDATDAADAQRLLGLWRADPAYRNALLALQQGEAA